MIADILDFTCKNTIFLPFEAGFSGTGSTVRSLYSVMPVNNSDGKLENADVYLISVV